MVNGIETGSDEFVRADETTPPPARQMLVKDILDKVKTARAKYERTDFKRMKEDQDFLRFGGMKAWFQAEQYTANIIQKHVKQKVSTLYARNPTAIAKRKERMEYAIWDGSQESLFQAIQTIALFNQTPQTLFDQNGQPIIDPVVLQAQALLQDFQQGTAMSQIMEKIGKTMEILYTYYTKEQGPTYKKRMKHMVRRAITNGVGYVKVGFQRALNNGTDMRRNLKDAQNTLNEIQSAMDDLQQGKTTEDDGEVEDLKLMIIELQKKQEIIIREGLVFSFPQSTRIIPDPNTVELNGWVGTKWLAEEFEFTPKEIKKHFKIDLGNTSRSGIGSTGDKDTDALTRDSFRQAGMDMVGKDKILVWDYYDINTGLVYTVIDGYDDFARTPGVPDVEVEGFYPIYSFVPNDQEHEKEIFPLSDVRLLRHQQLELNRSREGLRRHRIANKPKYLSPAGSLQDEDKDNLMFHKDSAIIEIMGMRPGQNSADIIQP